MIKHLATLIVALLASWQFEAHQKEWSLTSFIFTALVIFIGTILIDTFRRKKGITVIKLEETIIGEAKQSLEDFKHFSSQPKNETDELSRSFHEFHAYSHLAHIEGSGLSEEAVLKLTEFNNEFSQVIRALSDKMQTNE